MKTLGENVTRVPHAASRTARARAINSARGRSNRSGGVGTRTSGVGVGGAGAGSAGDVGRGEGLAAGRAPEALFEFVAAGLVHEDGGGAALAQVAIAPAHQ